ISTTSATFCIKIKLRSFGMQRERAGYATVPQRTEAGHPLAFRLLRRRLIGEVKREEWPMVPSRTAFKRKQRPSRAAAAMAGVIMLAAAPLLAPGGASAADLVVAYDQSQLLRLPRPVSSVIIGNPSIA